MKTGMPGYFCDPHSPTRRVLTTEPAPGAVLHAPAVQPTRWRYRQDEERVDRRDDPVLGGQRWCARPSDHGSPWWSALSRQRTAYRRADHTWTRLLQRLGCQ